MCETGLKLNPQRSQLLSEMCSGESPGSDSLRAPWPPWQWEKAHLELLNYLEFVPVTGANVSPPCFVVLWKFSLKLLRCSLTDSGGSCQAVGQGHPSSSSPPWWQSTLPVGFSCRVCCVYLIKVQPLQLLWNSRHVFILISVCCQQVFP